MNDHQLIVNKTIVKAFDTFNSKYALKAISICNILSKLKVIAVEYNDSIYVDKINLKEYEAFGNYINKEGFDASSTYAEIIINESVCSKLRLSEQEMMAAIAHEVGHIMFYFKSDKENFVEQGEEVCCDIYACRMGLAEPLYSLLNKLILSGDYPEGLVNQMKNRDCFIIPFLQDDGKDRTIKSVKMFFPSKYEIIDSYDGVDECGYRTGNSHNYGASSLIFVKEKKNGYGIIKIDEIGTNNEITDKDTIEIIPCKYDAVFSNDGEKIEKLNRNFFMHEEQDDYGCSYDVGVGDDIIFVKYQGIFLECDYFCEEMLSYGKKDKAEHFVCIEFNRFYYIDELGKYHLRKKYGDSKTFYKINLVETWAGNNVYDGKPIYVTTVDAINGNIHKIIIDSYYHNDYNYGSAKQFTIEADVDEIIELKVESKNSLSIKVKKKEKVCYIVVGLVRKHESPTIYRKDAYERIEDLLVKTVHYEEINSNIS